MSKKIRRHWKSFLLVLFFVIGSASLVIITQLTAKSTAVAKISFYLGEVKTQGKVQTKWYQVKIYQPLKTGDKIKTFENSKSEIALADGSVIRMDSNSTMDMVDLKKDKSTQTAETKVWAGKVWANVGKMGKRTKFSIESPTAVAAVRGTVYRMTVDTTAKTLIRVYTGAVNVNNKPLIKKAELEKKKGEMEGPQEVEGPKEVAGPHEVTLEEWTQIVAAQQQITVNPDGTYELIKFDPQQDAQDEWVRWNQERDERLRR